ncbi:MAG: DEAD/DEAH box helicase [Clostridia bacterium]|nr:DEAD/DEAH box helicase [Clostridia bacterium]
MTDIFSEYAPFIQDFIYKNNWESLRAVQVAAGDVIFHTDDNLLLCASTASGKTEAAFFPILSQFYEDPPATVGAVYIGPLKALINDQFSRLNDLCAEAEIPVWHWHGDVPQTHKNKLLKHPSGILQITPESLEALLMHKHAYVTKLFGDLRYIVIDEVHSLMRGDRGGQTLCLIERLSRMAGVNPRRIGLSATVGDLEATGAFLSAGTGRRTAVPKIEAKGVRWRISMEHFYVSGPQAAEESGKDPVARSLSSVAVGSGKSEVDAEECGISQRINADKQRAIENAMPVLDMATDEAPPNADPGVGYIFEHTRGKKCLVFTNSREECEAVTTTLRQYCELKHEPDRFYIHHGNLSASYRETAETAMKDDDSCQTTVTTATLELGIDIGRLERAFQIDAPFTVSSFLQRMGRTGRRGLPPEMWFVIREDMPEVRAMLPTTVPWKLLQGIALVQSYAEERFVEPPRLDRYPYSLLYHQTLCTLASCGELSPAGLAQRVLSLSYFHKIDKEDYKLLLRHMIANDYIQPTEGGGLIVGLAGERQTNSFKFYAVFQENEEYAVRCGQEELGTIVSPPPPGEKLALAGHVWEVEEVDHKRRLIYCKLVKGKVPAYFGQCPGDIHTKILERMRQVLREEKQYPYLMENAAARLAHTRRVCAASGIATEPLIQLGGDMWALFPWLGTYSFLALERFIRRRCAPELGLKKLEPGRPYFIQLTMKAGREEFFRVLKEKIQEPLDPLDLVYPGEVPVFEKYDEFVPPELIRKGFAYGVLDIEGMKQRIESW